MENDPLNAAVLALPAEERVAEAYALILHAVYSYYFAKELNNTMGDIIQRTTGPLHSALEQIHESVLKTAVIAIAKTIDETTGRTRSLPHALKALQLSAGSSPTGPDEDSETEATIQLLGQILKMTNPDNVKSLLYVRHVRNKWAGHASWDLSADTWPTGDNVLNFPLLEDGLIRMVNAFEEFGVLLGMSPYLRSLENAVRRKTVSEDGTSTLRVTVAWKEVVPMAHTMRSHGQESAKQLLKQFEN